MTLEERGGLASSLPDRRFMILGGALGVAVFAAVWWSVEWLTRQAGFYGPAGVVDGDIVYYQRAADAILTGRLPYRDFQLSYPPAALPVLVIPALLSQSGGGLDAYRASFEWLMLILGALTIVLVMFTLWRLRATRGRIALVAAFMAVSPFLIGPLLLHRYDLWPAALTAGSLVAVVSGRHRVGAVLLGAAVVAKVYPIVLGPVMLAYVWRRAGRREAIVGMILAGLMAVLVLMPFLLVAAVGVLQTFTDALVRPLQVESLGGALLLVLHGVTGLNVDIVFSFNSFNLSGPLPDAILLVQSVVLVAALVGVWAWSARVSQRPDRLVLAAAALVCAYVTFGKVFSPQYMIWLIPLVPLIPGRRGLAAIAILTAALLLTVSFYPNRYSDLVFGLDPGVARIVLLRDLTMVALVTILLAPWRAVWQMRSAFAPIVERARAAYRAFDQRWPVRDLVPDAGTVLLIVLALSLLLRAAWLNLPQGALIFDEAYYVNAARVVAGIHPAAGAHYADQPLFLDPNTEHPPLGKVLLAGSILLFGDNGLGWRIPSLVAGMVALVALYGVVRAAGGRPWLGVLAVALYSLDVLSFIHGRIGTLDMMSVAFLLVGAWLGLRGRWALAGAALALGTLIKVPGVYGLLAALLWQGLGLWRTYRQRRLAWSDFAPTAALVGAYAFVGLAGLWLLDLRFTTYATPLDHINHMLTYGFALQGAFNPTGGITSAPWQWLVNDGQFDYLKTAVNTIANGNVIGSKTTIQFRALLNPALLGAAPLAVLFGVWLAWKRGEALVTWALLWIAATYLPYWELALLSNRITYLYYVLPAVPGLAVLVGAFLVHGRLPRAVVWGFLGVTILAFIAYFPFREVP